MNAVEFAFRFEIEDTPVGAVVEIVDELVEVVDVVVDVLADVEE